MNNERHPLQAGGRDKPAACPTGPVNNWPPYDWSVHVALVSVVSLLLLFPGVGRGDDKPAPTNPFAGQESAIQEGGVLFRQNCVGCHGTRGRGGKGPDLTDDFWQHGSQDQDLFRVIRSGVRGTTMKEMTVLVSDEKIWKIIAFVRTLARTAGDPDWQPYLPGDPVAGKKLFFDDKNKANCIKCHAVDGTGGHVGPALSHIASQRSPRYIMEALVLPSADIDPNYEGVVVTTARGRVITGLRVNEDTFTIQLRDQETGRLLSFFKHELETIQNQQKSLMPDNLVEQITVKELHDLFAYLMTLKGRQPTAAKAK